MKLIDLLEGLQKRRIRKQTHGWVVYDPANEMYASGPRLPVSTSVVQDIHIFDDEEDADKARELFRQSHEGELEGHADETELARMILAEPNRNWNWHGNGWKGDDAVKWAKKQLRSTSPDKDRWQVRKVRVTYEF
jgi:hypothetical protein